MDQPELFPRCALCRDTHDVMPRTGYCHRCNRLRLAAEAAAKTGGEALRRADQRVDLARQEGLRFGPKPPDQVLSGVDLEHRLTLIAEAAVGEPLYFGHAGLLEAQLSIVEQRKFLEVLEPLGRAAFRQRAEKIARRARAAPVAKQS